MNPIALIIWHFGGLGVACVGAYLCAGVGGALLVFGVWAIVATMFDAGSLPVRKRKE
jgi:hypothetical protein